MNPYHELEDDPNVADMLERARIGPVGSSRPKNNGKQWLTMVTSLIAVIVLFLLLFNQMSPVVFKPQPVFVLDTTKIDFSVRFIKKVEPPDPVIVHHDEIPVDVTQEPPQPQQPEDLISQEPVERPDRQTTQSAPQIRRETVVEQQIETSAEYNPAPFTERRTATDRRQGDEGELGGTGQGPSRVITTGSNQEGSGWDISDDCLRLLNTCLRGCVQDLFRNIESNGALPSFPSELLKLEGNGGARTLTIFWKSREVRLSIDRAKALGPDDQVFIRILTSGAAQQDREDVFRTATRIVCTMMNDQCW